MCFSATASFAASAVLIAGGATAVGLATRAGRKWVPLAALPVAFGIQQGLEGLVWIGHIRGDPSFSLAAGYGFVFFSHFFWPAWAPFAVAFAEDLPAPRRRLAAFAVVGAAFGALTYAALVLKGALVVAIIESSVAYNGQAAYESFIPSPFHMLLYAAYAGIVLPPFFMSSHRGLRRLGALLTLALMAAMVVYRATFISVWCFAAALVSLGVLLILRDAARARLGARVPDEAAGPARQTPRPRQTAG